MDIKTEVQSLCARRSFLKAAALGGASAFLGLRPDIAVGAEPELETRRIRLVHASSAICVSPQYMAESILATEGFTDVQYLKEPRIGEIYPRLAAGDADIMIAFVAPFVLQVEAGAPIVMLAGTHPGCYELFTRGSIRSVKDLKGRKVSIPDRNGAHHLFTAMLVTHVGLDPQRDIDWVVQPPAEAQRQLAEGGIDALVCFPPVPQELRAKKIGRSILSSVADKPWNQYFCCVVAANREFVKKNPVATKRALRAILKGNHVCATEPEKTARFLVDRGITPNYDYALQALKELPYARWRDYSTEDTVRFTALRLQEGGFIKSNPKVIIAKGTDWRFLNEISRELRT